MSVLPVFEERRRNEERANFFGSIIGTTALIRDYKPVTELNDVARNIGVFDFEGDELTAIEFIGKLSAKERSVSVATLQLADNNYRKVRDANT